MGTLDIQELIWITGRAWTYKELSGKAWDDLHQLWWVCAKERNRIATSENERDRTKAGFGDYEAEERVKVVCSFELLL